MNPFWPIPLGQPRGSISSRGWLWGGLAAAVILLAGCRSSVNQELIASPTPYPVRSPVTSDGLVGVLEVLPTGPAATAAAALRRGDGIAAEAAFSTVIAATPAGTITPDVYLGRATARNLAGNPQRALDDLDLAVRLAPERADILIARGSVFSRLGMAEAAFTDFSTALQRDPGSASAYEGRGLAQLSSAQGDPVRYQAALDEFKRAVALDPTLVTARIGPALVYVDRAAFRGNPADRDQALQALDAFPDLSGDVRVVVLRARILAERGDPAEAERALQTARAGIPDQAPAERAVVEAAAATVALEGGDWTLAESAARSAISMDPFNWDARRTLARAQLGREDAVGALATVDELLQALPADGQSLYLRGLALTSLGRGVEARRALEVAREALPASPVYQARIAEALERVP